MWLFAEGEENSKKVGMDVVLVQDAAHEIRRYLQRLDCAFRVDGAWHPG